MRILMVAAPGAGKGTQAQRLAQHYGIEHLASGDLLRQEMAAGTAIGEAARAYVERGDYVPDDLVLRLVLDRAALAADAGGFVLDGFPRTVAQAEAVDEQARTGTGLSLHAVVHLEVGRAELRRRMLARAGDGQRSDDRASVIDHRLAVYDEQTRPLLDHYREQGILVSIDGERPADDVTSELLDALDGISAPS